MSQNSSVPQAVNCVSQVLKRDRLVVIARLTASLIFVGDWRGLSKSTTSRNPLQPRAMRILLNL
jgi:hypothetical protein